MGVVQLLRWQWDGYQRYHQSRANLVLHILVVPLFLAGNILLVVALARAWWLTALVSLAAMVVSVALQGRGHGREAMPPEPFTGPANAVGRIFLEQWVTFPRFVLSGGWWRALRNASAR
ncbi:MAG TPA: Mpo1-like protein [Ramlibacter sp.]|uniref:Mpo1-like protein n=1 Tax=Ramlibacter sp. TaxID=1917967 RepID=UPI002D25BA98|nr:Mpo1-like protein [Ramlibacter sp.]HZY19949.1 Mpo1-like protein [Ramlibacter sp.]